MDTKKIGAFIAANRKQKGMTQVQLAEKLGVTGKTVSRWENGNYMPDLSLLIPLSQELEITLNELLSGEKIAMEQAGERAAETLADTVRYSGRQIKKNRRQTRTVLAGFMALMLILCAVVYVVYVRKIPGSEEVSIWLPIVFGTLAVGELVFAIYDVAQDWKLQDLPKQTEGVVTGLVRSHLFKNDVIGEVPGETLIGWGTAQGEQYWGGMLKMRIPPWFPCVKYQIGEKEYSRLTGEGTYRDVYDIGEKVTILYDEKKPGVIAVQGDRSLRTKAKMELLLAVICAVITIVSIILLVS